MLIIRAKDVYCIQEIHLLAIISNIMLLYISAIDDIRDIEVSFRSLRNMGSHASG